MRQEYEYIVVGSGAGGGPVAANLARAGHSVLLLEAGGDALELAAPRSPADDYRVPVFHPFSAENPALSWEFFVRHYGDDERQRRDPKFCPEQDGVFYPRAGTLGGCSAHNALITVYPSNQDWRYIAELTGDPSWEPQRMRAYFERLENCRHRPPYRWLRKLTGWNPTRHGWNGWLSVEKSLPMAALGDEDLVKVVERAALESLLESPHPLRRLWRGLRSQFDPNDWRNVRANAEGVRYAPLATHRHERNSTRDLVRRVEAEHPDRLQIELDALATRVLLEGDTNRAVGVDYLKGARLYRAHPEPSGRPGEERTAWATREVILAGGVFNTPQLLMLSGIGPPDELDRHGIKVRHGLAGVGKNLQDRYEVGVVYRLPHDWEMLEGAEFVRGDKFYERWARKRKGPYTTNGSVMAVIRKSSDRQPVPDLFIFAILGTFRGYYPGYSDAYTDLGQRNRLTWAVLKGHTRNTAGEVTLASADPRDRPRVNFRYFEEGNDRDEEDLAAVVRGIEIARDLGCRTGNAVELLPGPAVQTPDELRQFVRDHAWGHHASCTCPIGPPDRGGVLDGNFRVHGTEGLRVVDASAFPRIPGLFILSAIYMIAEKASDAILADAR